MTTNIYDHPHALFQKRTQPSLNAIQTRKITKNALKPGPYKHKNIITTLRAPEKNLYDVYQQDTQTRIKIIRGSFEL
jgi:hypothetical protein